jgi:DNA polymerase-3 subunit gamma/tau
VTTALYRRYRPDTFEDVIGQDHVTVPLRTALAKNRVNHAYLFSGPRGCGKTTSARILARCLNCEQGPTPTPCGVCPSCVDLATGSAGSLDVIEIDAASHGGVDDARDLRERATFAPARDRYKIFIIDEAHMVTSAGFNALLKIVEEPPEHIKFIFATTEPEKVIGTIRSRTHHYPFRLIAPEPMLEYVEQLCAAEGIAVAPGVLPLVIRAGGGSGRDTLSVLDQLMAGATAEGISYDLAVSLLGYTHAELLDDVVDALGARDAATVFGAVDRVIQSGLDPRRFVEDLLERFRDLIVVRALGPEAATVLHGVPADQLERMAAQATGLGGSELSRWGDVTNQALSEMTGATSPRLHLELLCARLLLPSADDSERGLAARVDRLERNLHFSGTPVESGSLPDGVGSPSGAGAPSAPGSGAPAEWAGQGGGAAAARRALRAAQGDETPPAPAPAPSAAPVAAPRAAEAPAAAAPVAAAAQPSHPAEAPVQADPVEPVAAPEPAAAPVPQGFSPAEPAAAPQPAAAPVPQGFSPAQLQAPTGEAPAAPTQEAPAAPLPQQAAQEPAAADFGGVSDFHPTAEELAEAEDDSDGEFEPIEYPEDQAFDAQDGAPLAAQRASAPAAPPISTPEAPAAPAPQRQAPSLGEGPLVDPTFKGAPLDASPIEGGEDHVAKAREFAQRAMAAAAAKNAQPSEPSFTQRDAQRAPAQQQAPAPEQRQQGSAAPEAASPAAPAAPTAAQPTEAPAQPSAPAQRQAPAPQQSAPQAPAQPRAATPDPRLAAQARQAPAPQERAPQQPQQQAPQQTQPTARPEFTEQHGAPAQGGAPTQGGDVPHPAGGAGSVEMFRRAWPQIMDHLKDSRKFVWSMVQPHVSLAGFDGRTLVLAFAHPGPLTAFRSRPEAVDLVRASIREVLGVDPEIDVTQGGEGGPKADGRPAPASPVAPASSPFVPRSSGPELTGHGSGSAPAPGQSAAPGQSHDSAAQAPTAERTAASAPTAAAQGPDSTPADAAVAHPAAPEPTERAVAPAPERPTATTPAPAEPAAATEQPSEQAAAPAPQAARQQAVNEPAPSPARPAIDPRLLTDQEEPWDPYGEDVPPVDSAWELAPSRSSRAPQAPRAAAAPRETQAQRQAPTAAPSPATPAASTPVHERPAAPAPRPASQAGGLAAPMPAASSSAAPAPRPTSQAAAAEAPATPVPGGARLAPEHTPSQERPAAPAPSAPAARAAAPERAAAPSPAQPGEAPAAPLPGGAPGTTPGGTHGAGGAPAAPAPSGLGWGQAPSTSWGSAPQGAPEEAPAPAKEARTGRKSKYQELMARAQASAPAAEWGAPRGGRQAPPVESEPVDFVPSEDDEELENSTTFGRAALERLLDATLIVELDQSGQPIEQRRR